jgi:hypothetical protein
MVGSIWGWFQPPPYVPDPADDCGDGLAMFDAAEAGDAARLRGLLDVGA